MHPYPTSPPAGSVPPRRRWAQLWLPALFVVAALVATVVYLNTGDDSAVSIKPDGTADRFYAAVNAHDQAAWSALLCDPGKAGKLSNFKSVSLMTAPSPSVDGSSATAKGRFRLTTDVFLKQFRDYDFSVQLSRSNDRWCIDHLQSTPSKEATGPSPFPISPSPGTSTPSTPAPSASTSGARACRLPASASTSPAPVPPDVLDAGLSDRFATPTLKWTLNSVSSYCYDGVQQDDLRLLLAYLDGAFTAQPSTKPNQKTFTSTSTGVKPAHTVVTVNGSLKIDSELDDTGTGSVEVDWY